MTNHILIGDYDDLTPKEIKEICDMCECNGMQSYEWK